MSVLGSCGSPKADKMPALQKDIRHDSDARAQSKAWLRKPSTLHRAISTTRLCYNSGMTAAAVQTPSFLPTNPPGRPRWGTAQATIAAGVLGQVLLVIGLGVVKLWGIQNFGGNVAVTSFVELFLIDVPGGFGQALLFIGVNVDAGAVLGADIVTPGACPWVGSWFSQKTFRTCS